MHLSYGADTLRSPILIRHLPEPIMEEKPTLITLLHILLRLGGASSPPFSIRFPQIIFSLP